MEEIFIAIMERIAEKMPELSYIDEDYGQLEMGAEEDQYPVTFPCVLIGNTHSLAPCSFSLAVNAFAFSIAAASSSGAA